MRLELQVESVDYLTDGTAIAWLRTWNPEPGTSHFPTIPAFVDHQNVKVGDWWGISLTLIARDGKYVRG